MFVGLIFLATVGLALIFGPIDSMDPDAPPRAGEAYYLAAGIIMFIASAGGLAFWLLGLLTDGARSRIKRWEDT